MEACHDSRPNREYKIAGPRVICRRVRGRFHEAPAAIARTLRVAAFKNKRYVEEVKSETEARQEFPSGICDD